MATKRRCIRFIRYTLSALWWCVLLLLFALLVCIIGAKLRGEVPKIFGYSVMQIVSGSSINSLLSCLLHRLNSCQGFAVISAFNQCKRNILPVVQQPNCCYILWIIGNGYFAPRQKRFGIIIMFIP